MNSSSRRAYTLPDALAAAGCLAAIAAVSAAALAGATRADLTAQDQANLMTIGAAAAAWSADHQGLIPGAPGASARELLNDPNAIAGLEASIFTKGLATQPFDWASPIAWGYLTDAPAPERRDIRLAYALGVEPKLVDPDAKEPVVADAPPIGALSVLSDPAQTHLSMPFDGSPQPGGLPNTYFAVQNASSYIAAREFLWWGQGGIVLSPRWVNQDTFWGGRATFNMDASWNTRLPGRSASAGTDSHNSFARSYRPYINRVGPPSRKIYLANGTRFQSADTEGADHDINANAGFGGAFADTGAWASDPNAVGVSRAWPEGTNAAGEDMSRISFRHGDETIARGNVLFYDASVQLTDIDEARDPALWLPRGSTLSLTDIPEAYRDSFSEHVEYAPGQHALLDRIIIW